MSSTISKLYHDELVLKEALALLADGYAVKARVEGLFSPPDVIYGYRPDVLAEAQGHHLIVEVKKGDVDWPKLNALDRYVQEHPGYEIRVIAAPAPEKT